MEWFYQLGNAVLENKLKEDQLNNDQIREKFQIKGNYHEMIMFNPMKFNGFLMRF